MKTSQHIFGLGKWFFSYIFAQFAEAGNDSSKAVHLIEEECNKYDLTVAPWFLIGQS
jgi:hypothetical protein